MTAVQAPAAPPRRGFFRRGIRILAKPNKEAQNLLSGRRVHLRFLQSLAWVVIAGILGASFMAGLYYLVLEQHWYIHIGSFNHGSSAKKWWDSGMGFIHSGSWVSYRHALRDLGGPAVATMAIRTLLAKPKYWDVRVSTARLVTAPLVILAATLLLCLGGTYLLDFGGPAAWAHLFGHHRLHLGFLGRASAGQLILGFIIGQILHRYWAPVGATLQGFVLDRSIDRAQSPGGHVPLWVRLPASAPVVRERFAKMYRSNDEIKPVGGTHRLALSVSLAAISLITIAGLIAKFWIAHGHGFPYLT